MFCAFEGRPRILRLHGRGRCVEPHDEEWEELAKAFPSYAGARSIIVVDVMRIADSCGYGIPLYHYSEERTQLSAWAERKGEGVCAITSKSTICAASMGFPACARFKLLADGPG